MSPTQQGPKRSLEIQPEFKDPFQFAITKSSVQIGRAPDNDLQLEDERRRISRHHALISIDSAGVVTIEDQGSSNGTRVNGVRITAPTQLNSRDVILVGPYRIVFTEEREGGPNLSMETGGLKLDQVQQRVKLLDMVGALGPADTADIPTLELVHDISVNLARTYTLEELSEKGTELTFRIPNVHRAALMPWNEAAGAFHDAPLRFRGGQRGGADSFDPRSVVMSKTILDYVRRENRPLIVHDTQSDARVADAKSIFMAGIQAAMCSPLSYQGRFLGVLYADNLGSAMPFLDQDLSIFTIIAAQAGVALSHILARAELSRRETERAAMRLYVPPQVFSLIEKGDKNLQLGGTLQSLSVLFADIRGFTTLSERLAPTDVVKLLNEFFTVMASAVFDAGGTLDKFIGDCVMALFGAPISAEDSPVRAVESAVQMQRRVRDLSLRRVAAGLEPIRIGIGIHTGEAVVGNIGSTERMQYTAIGDTVNISARLVGKAAAGEILVSSETKRAIGELYPATPLGELELKGKTNKVGVHSITWDSGDQTTRYSDV